MAEAGVALHDLERFYNEHGVVVGCCDDVHVGGEDAVDFQLGEMLLPAIIRLDDIGEQPIDDLLDVTGLVDVASWCVDRLELGGWMAIQPALEVDGEEYTQSWCLA